VNLVDNSKKVFFTLLDLMVKIWRPLVSNMRFRLAALVTTIVSSVLALRLLASIPHKIRRRIFMSDDVSVNAFTKTLFDSAWYSRQYGVSEQEAINHFESLGKNIGYDPNPWFDQDWYHSELERLGIKKSLGECWLTYLNDDHNFALGPNPSFTYLTRLSQAQIAWFLKKINLGILYAMSKSKKMPKSVDFLGKKAVEKNSALLIPVYGNWQWTDRCLRALSQTEAPLMADVFCIDDHSEQGVPDYIVRQYPWVTWSRNEANLGFLKSCNRFLRTIPENKYEFVMLLNNDTEPQPGFLTALVKDLDSRPEVGLVGSKLVFGDGQLQEAGGIIFSDASGWNYGRGANPNAKSYNFHRYVDYVSGASIAIRLKLFQGIGYFDEQFAPAYFEDSDLAFSVRSRGFEVMYCPTSVVVHHESKSYGTAGPYSLKDRQLAENRVKFSQKWTQDLKRQMPATPLSVRKARSRPQIHKTNPNAFDN
jgi:GT2 family glycosyltransferase